MIINHPLLGPRDAAEFVYLGDAILIERPDWMSEKAMNEFYEYQYIRNNPDNELRELWYHEHGDRSWIVVTRNPTTHEILNVELASEVARKLGRSR